MRAKYLLFPGRHHLLTKFQAGYLGDLAKGASPKGQDVALETDPVVIWAVTSANHQNTRRNPIPFDRREAAIERFSVEEGLMSLVIPVFDTAPNEQFADVTIKNIENATAGEVRLSTANAIVACSTPSVVDLYKRLGFQVLPVELGHPDEPLRPWDVLLLLASGDERWRELAHRASVNVFERYHLVEAIRRIHTDPLIGEEGGLTSTRDYRTYVDAFEASAERKWRVIAPNVRPGRILDIGCASGAMLECASRDPRLAESDLIGIEVARPLYEECIHKKSQGAFRNPNVYFYQRNILSGDVFSERSIDTTLSVALTHEIYSYGDRDVALRTFTETVYRHTVESGVWINSDVCGPDDKDRIVHLRLVSDDGANPDQPEDLDGWDADAIERYVAALSTRARFDQFVRDFRQNAGVAYDFRPIDATTVEVRLADAMEFLTRKDYTENWLSETHEQFCAYDFTDWTALIESAGFELEPASRAWRNDWIINNRISPKAQLADANGTVIDWPVTHVLLICRRPLNS